MSSTFKERLSDVCQEITEGIAVALVELTLDASKVLLSTNSVSWECTGFS